MAVADVESKWLGKRSLKGDGAALAARIHVCTPPTLSLRGRAPTDRLWATLT